MWSKLSLVYELVYAILTCWEIHHAQVPTVFGKKNEHRFYASYTMYIARDRCSPEVFLPQLTVLAKPTMYRVLQFAGWLEECKLQAAKSK